MFILYTSPLQHEEKINTHTHMQQQQQQQQQQQTYCI